MRRRNGTTHIASFAGELTGRRAEVWSGDALVRETCGTRTRGRGHTRSGFMVREQSREEPGNLHERFGARRLRRVT